MNFRLVLKTLGKVLLIQAGYMTLSVMVSLYYGESVLPFVWPIVAMLITAALCLSVRVKNTVFQAREGMVCVALIWLGMSLFGGMPFLGQPGFRSVIDCFFESASGFSTTGATVLSDIECLPKGVLFWRSSTHWLGGMGILVLALALFPSIGDRAQNLMAAESPGPTCDKLTSRISTSSKILYAIYSGLTVAEMISLLLAGLPLYDAVVTALSTAGTGGFSVMNLSIAGYMNPAAEWIIAVFMMLYGINFTVFFLIFTGQWRKGLRNHEFLFYIGIVLGATALITTNILSMSASFGEAVRNAFFSVNTVVSTSGFITADFGKWPAFSRTLITLLMFMGASAGSTGGGIKCSRIMILFKAIGREIRRFVTPKRVSVLRMDDKTIEESTVTNTFVFLGVYALLLLGGTLVASLDGFDFTTCFTSTLSCLSNVGPAFGKFGPTGNYAEFSLLTKVVFSLWMLIGRLEIFPVIMLAAPATWKDFTLKNR